MTPNVSFKVTAPFEVKYFENGRCKRKVTIECEYEIIYDLSNGDVPNDLECPITGFAVEA